MFRDFTPNYTNIVDAAENRRSKRLPMYEHNISAHIMEKVMGREFAMFQYAEPKRFFAEYNEFCRVMGYDVVTFEACVTDIFPGGGALGGHKKGVIQSWEDFRSYPWDSLAELFFRKFSSQFSALRETMPEGMKAIGGVGNGVFECVEDLCGYADLCYLEIDEPELYTAMFERVGETLLQIWTRFMREFGDVYCVCRIGDDMGFNTSTLISPESIRENVVPQYKRVIELIHGYGKPFLLHSCGSIFPVMEDFIGEAHIDAKHSNEDGIAPFSRWIDDYGDRIGNFGGIDMNVICDISETDVASYVSEVLRYASRKNGGVAIGSGNSIPDYVSVEKYLKMLETVRVFRGEKK